jgi:2'-5' RNA ligase
MRAFIGLEFGDDLKKELYNIQEILKINSNKGSWVSLDNFHVTLKFLGNINKSQINSIEKSIKAISINTSPISITLEELGYFNVKNGEYRVIWIGINGEMMKLKNIYDIIEKDMNRIGFPIEKRRFTPHITLGRRVKTKLPFNKLEESIKHKLGTEFLLDNLTLMKSEEIMRKRVYTPIKSYKFQNLLDKNHR